MKTELKLNVGLENGRSVITESYFTSPLKLGTPNGEDERLKVVLMMASAGVLKGDTFEYNIVCGKGTKTLLTDQSYMKIFDTGEGKAEKKQSIFLEENASLYYRPCAAVPFSGSRFDGDTVIHLKPGSELIYADIVTGGRIGMGECFKFKHFRNRMRVYENDRLVWMDHCLLEPTFMDLTDLVFFDGHTHQGTFYYYGNTEKEEKIMAVLMENDLINYAKVREIGFGVSRAFKGLCVRVLAGTAQDIEEFFDRLELVWT